MIKVCLASATGWAGSELARAISKTDDIDLVAGVSRIYAGRRLGDILGGQNIGCPVYASTEQGLADACDVFVEYTKPDIAKTKTMRMREK